MKVYQAINKVQQDLARIGVGKNQENKFDNYKFRGIDDIYNAMAPLLAKHELCILPEVLERENVERVGQGGKALFYVTVKVKFAFVSAEDGSKHEVITYGEAMDRGDKATNKAMSAAYKYACFQAFCMPTEGDNDADASTHEIEAQTRAGYQHDSHAENLYIQIKGFIDDGNADEMCDLYSSLNENEKTAVWKYLTTKEKAVIRAEIYARRPQTDAA